MARYMLIEVDDNETSKALYTKLKLLRPKGVRVIAIFAKATMLCECVVRHPKSVMGSKLRWWLCPECHRPKSGAGQNLTINLLNPTKRDFHIRLGITWYSRGGTVNTQLTGEQDIWGK